MVTKKRCPVLRWPSASVWVFRECPASSVTVTSGNAVDFIRYPPGKSPKDVVAVIPHEGRRDDSLVKAFAWTL
jgi:hypothetical protein